MCVPIAPDSSEPMKRSDHISYVLCVTFLYYCQSFTTTKNQTIPTIAHFISFLLFSLLLCSIRFNNNFGFEWCYTNTPQECCAVGLLCCHRYTCTHGAKWKWFPCFVRMEVALALALDLDYAIWCIEIHVCFDSIAQISMLDFDMNLKVSCKQLEYGMYIASWGISTRFRLSFHSIERLIWWGLGSVTISDIFITVIYYEV